MLVSVASIAIAEFLEFLLHGICLLYLLIFTKPAYATGAQFLSVKNRDKTKFFTYRVDLMCKGEQRQGTLVERVKNDGHPLIVTQKNLPLRFDGKKCYIMKPVIRRAVRSLAIAVAAAVVTFVVLMVMAKG